MDVREHSNIDDGISEPRKKHGDVSNKERSDSALPLFWCLEITQGSFCGLEIGLEQTHIFFYTISTILLAAITRIVFFIQYAKL